MNLALEELLAEKRSIEARIAQDTIKLRELRAKIRAVRAYTPKIDIKIQNLILSTMQEKK